ncbi:hypothetical protein [Clostridium tertium]|uniref:Uncharacterized protein n=1 Tax=Clostridium tertium TaxID=1559 RepID=A0A6N3FAE3_9CLOT
MKKIKKISIIALICCLLFIVISFISPRNLYGKWYLYKGSDINADSYIDKKLNQKDYIEISEGSMKEFRSDGKDGVGDLKVRGSKIYSGDTIFKYKVNEIGEHKVLELEVIGYDNGHEKWSAENGEKYTYVFDKNVNFE